jgi:hypothetical protein
MVYVAPTNFYLVKLLDDGPSWPIFKFQNGVFLWRLCPPPSPNLTPLYDFLALYCLFTIMPEIDGHDRPTALDAVIRRLRGLGQFDTRFVVQIRKYETAQTAARHSP